MSTDQQIQERAESLYPTRKAEGNVLFNDLQKQKQACYIKGATEERELMSNQWVPISEYDMTTNPKVCRWHRIWN